MSSHHLSMYDDPEDAGAATSTPMILELGEASSAPIHTERHGQWTISRPSQVGDSTGQTKIVGLGTKSRIANSTYTTVSTRHDPLACVVWWENDDPFKSAAVKLPDGRVAHSITPKFATPSSRKANKIIKDLALDTVPCTKLWLVAPGETWDEYKRGSVPSMDVESTWIFKPCDTDAGAGSGNKDVA